MGSEIDAIWERYGMELLYAMGKGEYFQDGFLSHIRAAPYNKDTNLLGLTRHKLDAEKGRSADLDKMKSAVVAILDRTHGEEFLAKLVTALAKIHEDEIHLEKTAHTVMSSSKSRKPTTHRSTSASTYSTHPSSSSSSSSQKLPTRQRTLPLPSSSSSSSSSRFRHHETPISSQPISSQPISSRPISSQPISSQPISTQPFSSQSSSTGLGTHSSRSKSQTRDYGYEHPRSRAGTGAGVEGSRSGSTSNGYISSVRRSGYEQEEQMHALQSGLSNLNTEGRTRSRSREQRRNDGVNSAYSVISQKPYRHLSPDSSRELADLRTPGFDDRFDQPRDEFTDIRHEDNICLRSGLLHSYATLDDKTGNLIPTGASPMSFKICKKSPSRLSKVVEYGDVVFLASPNGDLLATDGVVVRPVRDSQGKGKGEWKIMSVRNNHKGSVKITQNVLFQCGDQAAYLAVNRRGEISLSRSHTDPSASWNISKGNLPFIPPWMKERFDLQRSPVDLSSSFSSFEQFNELPRSHQEKVIIENLLAALLAIDSEHFCVSYNDDERPIIEMRATRWRTIDDATSRLVSKILPLCNAYAHLESFIEIHSGYQCGLVSQALCAAIRALIKDYLVLVAQLEHQLRIGQLTLQKLWFYIQTSIRTLRSIQRLCQMIEEKQKKNFGIIGGALLNVIHEALIKEGPTTRELYIHLISKASVPYFKILSRWIYRGIIQDNYGEFQIQLKTDLHKENIVVDVNDRYWDQRYSINKHMEPIFLSKPSDRILTAGKYLNVVRESDRKIQHPHEQTLQYSRDHTEYCDKIDVAYAFASKKLLDLLINEEKLVARLRSMKRYFFLDKGDFFVHFADSAQSELSKPAAQVRMSKLQSLLELAIGSSTANSDPYKDDASCRIYARSLLQQLTDINSNVLNNVEQMENSERQADNHLIGFDAFGLDFKVNYPLTLIVSRMSREKYSFLCRQIFALKRVERQLCTSWLEHQSMKEMNRLGVSVYSSYRLRQQMLHFVQNVLFYMLIEVIEPNWHHFENQIVHASTVDELLSFHDQFLGKCLKACLLTSARHLKALSNLLKTCTEFSEHLNKLSIDLGLNSTQDLDSVAVRSLDCMMERRNTINGRRTIYANRTFSSNAKSLSSLEQQFTLQLTDFLAFLKASPIDSHFSNLCARLDYNGFYSKSVRQLQ